ncbi:MAG: glycosyltransferase [Hyphomicrobium sp.]
MTEREAKAHHRPKLLLYTHGLVDGGGERLWASLASALHARGYRVTFAQDFEAADNRSHLDPGIPVVTLGTSHITAVRRLADLLRREKPDVALSAVGGSNLKLLVARLLARAPTKTIISFHGFEEWRSGWLSWLTYHGLPILSRMADRTVAVSNGLGQALASRWGAATYRQRTLHNPVAFPAATALPTAAKLRAREDVVLAAGRLVPEKDYPTLLRAFARLDRPRARLVILGKGPERERLEAEVRRLGLENHVLMPGYAAEPWAHYARAKCFVMSSRSEQFGNVVVEALAHGLPVIATAAVGPKEVLDGGRHGTLVPIGDEAALATAMAQALDDPGDPVPRRARALEFSIDARVPAYEVLIDEVMRPAAPVARVYLDLTHLGRHVTGLERISIEQFEKQSFRGAEVRPIRSAGTLSMIAKQQLLIPLLALLNPNAVFAFPGFPPSPLLTLCRRRVVLYVHDLFLMTRPHDLSRKARAYMALPFRLAVRRLKFFLTNSEKTRAELLEVAAPDASVALYRPQVRNVFALSADGRAARLETPQPLRIVMVGTIEPRKNYAAALAIRSELQQVGFAASELHIIGREGWGDAARRLAGTPGVTLHGYLSLTDAKAVIESADLYLCTSHDEGLGLPLLEAQFAGLPVVAPDSVVFREVLGASGLFVDPSEQQAAARAIAAALKVPGWRADRATAALANVQRWNTQAEADAARAKGLFALPLDQSLGAVAPHTA